MVTAAFRTMLLPRQRVRLLVVQAGLLVAAALEMIGIGSIPAFVALLVEPERFFAVLPELRVVAWLRGLDTATLTLVGAATLATLFVIKNTYLALLNYVEGRLLRDIDVSISNRLYRAYLYTPYTFHLQRNPAELIRNVEGETARATAFVDGWIRLVRESLVLVVVFLLLVMIDPYVSFAVFVLLGVTAGAFHFLVRRSLAHRGGLAQAHRARQIQAISQGLGAIKDAKMLAREPFLIGQYDVETRGVKQQELYYRVVSSLPRLLLEVVAIAAVLLVAAVFVMLGRPAQTMLPVLALLAVAVIRLVPAFNIITAALARIRYERPSFDLIRRELQSLESESARWQKREPAPNRGLEHAISLVDVRYRYPGSAGDALGGVTLEIPRGEAVAITGPSGAGKSTLVDVILGLLTPAAGAVCVDRWSIHDELPVWQRQIGYVPQDIYLLDDTIRRNVAFGLPDAEIDDEAVAAALRVAQLEEFVRGLPDGSATLIGHRGVRMSGGQRQRLGVARALYHDPSVLVLDEATSALDHETEQAMIRDISALRGSRTVILVAHRSSTVEHCDRVFVLDHGRLVEERVAGREVRASGLQADPVNAST